MKTKAKMILYLTIVMFILSLSSLLYAQNFQDLKGVQLNDGTVIHGKIIESNVNQVIIEKQDGNRVSVKFDDVYQFLKDGQQAKPTNELSDKTPGISALELGMIYHYFDYQESIDPPLKSTEDGWIPGVYLKYTYKKKSTFYTKVYLSYASGDIDYDGSTLSGTPLSFSNQSATLIKFQWDVGYPVSVRENLLIIPYVGYGYHSWERGDTKIVGLPPALWVQEDYKRHNISFGIRADYDINPQWNIACSVAANIMFNGEMTYKSSELGAGNSDIGFDLDNKLGFYAEIPITYKFTNQWAIVATPWYEYSAFGKSGTEYYVYGGTLYSAYEPSSKTHQYGINLGISLLF